MLRNDKKNRRAVILLVFLFSAVALFKSNAAFGGTCLPVRALMLNLRTKEALGYYKGLITEAADKGFNVLFLEGTGFVRKPKLPDLKNPNAIEQKDLSELISLAKAQKMKVIPYLWLFSHQEGAAKFFYPELMLNEHDLDTTKAGSWDFQKKLIDDAIEVFNPEIIHIGHDEVRVAGRKWFENKLKPGTKMATPEEFFNNIIRIHDYLKNKGIKTMIWGDMFLTPDLSDGVYPSDLSAATPGYSGTPELSAMLDRLPRDIIIADWHYENNAVDYPSYDFFKEKGFIVWGATWYGNNNIETFTRYVKKRAGKDEGMIATTWKFGELKYKKKMQEIIDEASRVNCE